MSEQNEGESRAGGVRNAQASLWLMSDQAVLRSGSCSTKYVRGREAGEVVVIRKRVVANCNESLILRLGQLDLWSTEVE